MNTPLPGAGELPEHIGPYRILGVLGEGGMGRVFEALQLEPERRVALKVIRGPLATESLRRRFATEAQALACLNHPAIATIFATGTAEVRGESCPYIALERVEGQSLDSYLINATPSLSARVELLARTCDAVHHAHEKGVVHRDLKPANVMVDTRGRPKVLDFGIAHLSGDDDAARLTNTASGQLLGTLAYMSPEQLSGDSSRVDARSDVYALGVLLFESLSGVLPIPLGGLTLPEATRAITRGGAPALGTLDGRLRGDLETIASRALETEPGRRYSSAAELAGDLRRFLDHEPILARPMTSAYRLRKFAQRNRLLVTGAATTFGALGLGLLGTGAFAVRAQDRAAQAEQAQTTAARFEADMHDAERRALAHARIAVEAKQEAERQAKNAEAVRDLFLSVLDAARPARDQGRSMTVLDALTATTGELADQEFDDPEVEGAIHQTLAQIYATLASFGPAVEHSRIAIRIADEHLGASSPKARSARVWLANTLKFMGRPEDARLLFERVVESLDSPADLSTYIALGHLGGLEHSKGNFARAIELSLQALEGLRRLPSAEPGNVLWELHRLSTHYMMTGQHELELEAAEEAYRLALEVGIEDLTDPLDLPSQLANALDDNGRRTEALELYRETLDLSIEWYGEDHRTQMLRFNMALSLANSGEFDAALATLERAYSGMLAEPNRSDRDLLLVTKGLLDTYGLAGRPEQGLVWMDTQRPEVPDNFMGSLVQISRGQLLHDVGALEEALEITWPAYELAASSLPAGHAHLINALEVLVSAAEQLELTSDAERFRGLRAQHGRQLPGEQ